MPSPSPWIIKSYVFFHQSPKWIIRSILSHRSGEWEPVFQVKQPDPISIANLDLYIKWSFAFIPRSSWHGAPAPSGLPLTRPKYVVLPSGLYQRVLPHIKRLSRHKRFVASYPESWLIFFRTGGSPLTGTVALRSRYIQYRNIKHSVEVIRKTSTYEEKWIQITIRILFIPYSGNS